METKNSYLPHVVAVVRAAPSLSSNKWGSSSPIELFVDDNTHHDVSIPIPLLLLLMRLLIWWLCRHSITECGHGRLRSRSSVMIDRLYCSPFWRVLLLTSESVIIEWREQPRQMRTAPVNELWFSCDWQTANKSVFTSVCPSHDCMWTGWSSLLSERREWEMLHVLQYRSAWYPMLVLLTILFFLAEIGTRRKKTNWPAPELLWQHLWFPILRLSTTQFRSNTPSSSCNHLQLAICILYTSHHC